VQNWLRKQLERETEHPTDSENLHAEDPSEPHPDDPTLNAASRKRTSAEEERLLLTSGYVHVGKKKRNERGVILEAMSDSPLPLPETDIDEQTRQYAEGFEDAVVCLQGQHALLQGMNTPSSNTSTTSFAQTLCGHSALQFNDESTKIAHLQHLLKDKPEQEDKQQLGQGQKQWAHIKDYFALHAETSVPDEGICLLLMSIMVGKNTTDGTETLVQNGKLNSGAILQYMQKMLHQSQSSVQQAQKSMENVKLQRTMTRTFLSKR
jgi:hypothetical protein